MTLVTLLTLFSCKKEEPGPDPVAEFYAEVKKCENDTCIVYFYDNSVNSVSRNWDFGNGLSSILKTDSTEYLSGQSYEIVLKAKNLDGVERLKTKTIQL